MRTATNRSAYLLLTVLFVTSCVTYEPAASGLVSDQPSIPTPPGNARRAELPDLPEPSGPRHLVPGRPFVATKPAVRELVVGRVGPGAVRGQASYCAPTPKYCRGWQPPALVAAVSSFRYGDPRYTVTVQGPAGTVTVTVVSYGVLPKGRVIDLSPASFVRACGPLSMGVCRVVVKGLR